MDPFKSLNRECTLHNIRRCCFVGMTVASPKSRRSLLLVIQAVLTWLLYKWHNYMLETLSSQSFTDCYPEVESSSSGSSYLFVILRVCYDGIEYASQLPTEGGVFYTFDTMDSSRPHYRRAWPPILYAVSLWLHETGFTSVDKDDSRPANMKEDDHDISRFHLLIGIIHVMQFAVTRWNKQLHSKMGVATQHLCFLLSTELPRLGLIRHYNQLLTQMEFFCTPNRPTNIVEMLKPNWT